MTQSENQLANLIPFDKLTPEEAKELRKKGGIASGEARRERRTIREDLEILLDMGTKGGTPTPIEELPSLSEEAIENANLSYRSSMIIAMCNKALAGNVSAFEKIVKLTGEDLESKKEEEDESKKPIVILDNIGMFETEEDRERRLARERDNLFSYTDFMLKRIKENIAREYPAQSFAINQIIEDTKEGYNEITRAVYMNGKQDIRSILARLEQLDKEEEERKKREESLSNETETDSEQQSEPTQ